MAGKRVYGYDEQGRQFKTEHFVGSSSTTDRTETMTYNDRGQLELAIGEEGSIYYLYDNLGRQIEVRSTGESLDPTQGGFDVASVDFENITRYSYDELGRLKTVSAVERNDVLIDVAPMLGGDQADETTYFYDSVGNLERTLYGNGVGHNYERKSCRRKSCRKG